MKREPRLPALQNESARAWELLLKISSVSGFNPEHRTYASQGVSHEFNSRLIGQSYGQTNPLALAQHTPYTRQLAARVKTDYEQEDCDT